MAKVRNELLTARISFLTPSVLCPPVLRVNVACHSCACGEALEAWAFGGFVGGIQALVKPPLMIFARAAFAGQLNIARQFTAGSWSLEFQKVGWRRRGGEKLTPCWERRRLACKRAEGESMTDERET